MSTTVYPPIANKRYLVFDVETNGLMPSRVPYKSSSSKIEDYPYILQLSFAIYDVHEKKVIQQFDSYVDVPDDVKVPLESKNVPNPYLSFVKRSSKIHEGHEVHCAAPNVTLKT